MAIREIDSKIEGWLGLPDLEQAWQLAPGCVILFPWLLFLQFNARAVARQAGAPLDHKALAVDESPGRYSVV